MFYCGISGEPPREPVVSTKSGHVYERRLIVKYITENGTDPLTGEKLEESDLVAVKADPKATAPRPPTLTSVPALLHALQNEWDAVVLELFAMKQRHHADRQELSHALYQQDAATRVVARLVKERDVAREALANVQATLGVTPSAAPSNDVEMADGAEETSGLPADVTEEIDATHKTLSASRKKRKAPADYTTPAQVSSFTEKTTIQSLHSSSPSGITSMTLSRSQPSLLLTGGNDKIVQLYDNSTSKVVASLKGHTKRINHVALRESATGAPTLILSASQDKTARIWSHDAASGEYAPQSTFKTHKGDVTGLVVHPTSTLFALASADRTYSLHSLSTFQTVFQSSVSDDPYTSLGIHPDGTLLALGTPNAALQIFDVRTASLAASLAPAEAAPYSIPSASFSENGYHLLAPSSESALSVWDLRSLKSAVTIDLGEGFKVNKVKYDVGSAAFLTAVGSGGVRIYQHKNWKELASFQPSNNIEFTDLDWNATGSELWVAGGREVKIWGLPDA
ncbi:WD40 repeat-like protein [Sistotremastrum niveocremeum HHB9708]|uniref:Pre-mRNA-processing factor 19 n=1 Tax=Sistotremastrum niveocremeum HHB9708 TaxID=1314777 RepID=A0A164XP53_9AGAM|nr:WD40 repeat-like protein [Sistotremastrum niveocremeum HHB9708]